PAQPRYGTQYVGLRNRIAVLCESYVYAPYRDRVLATRDFVRSCLEFAAENKDAVRKVLTEAGGTPKAKAPVAPRHKAGALPGPVTVLGFVEEVKDGKRVSTGKPRDYPVEFLGRCEATLSVNRPYAYLFPAQFAKAAETLQRHGVEVEELREDVELDVEAYRV